MIDGAPQLEATIRERISRTSILLREREFSKLIMRLVPSIRAIYIAEQQIRHGQEATQFWDVEGQAVHHRVEFNWPLGPLAQFSNELNRKERRIVDGIFLDISLYKIDQRTMGLRCFLNYNDLADYEWRIIEYIIGELRFAALGAFDVSEKTYQIAEI